jgi:hypothetical protein
MVGSVYAAIVRTIERAMSAWLKDVAPRVLALAGSCPLARMLGVAVCLRPTAPVLEKQAPSCLSAVSARENTTSG